MELSQDTLLRLVEVELVSQYRRFLKKNLPTAPRNCRFNSLSSTVSGGVIRLCKCKGHKSSLTLASLVETVTDKPCTSLAHAKKCPLYQHYTGVEGGQVVSALTKEFILRLEDPIRCSASFKTLHTLWILLHEMDTSNLSWWVKCNLKLLSRLYTRRYKKYLLKVTPSADVTWEHLLSNFSLAIDKLTN